MDNQPVVQKITDTLELNYMPYAMSVIISRAIPEIDGFKPSHRKLLYTMYKMGLITGNRTKSSNVVGQTMKLNPHGDMAIYETMVRMTKGNAALLHPFVDSKGNFGKQYSRDMAFAAPRYTEVKLDEFCREIFGDIDKDTVDFADNYDGTMKEPLLLPVALPTILLNANQGIAVGMASNICSFNLKELCEATIAIIKHPNCDITDILPAPDFPGGAYLIYNRETMQEIYKTGRGSFRLRSKYIYDKKNNCIEISEIPYTTTSEAIIDKVVELIKDNKLKEISDIRDETDLSGLKITIDIKRGVDPDKLMTRLFKSTSLEDTFSCNFNVLIDGAPKVLGVYDILNEWIKFRVSCIKRGIGFDINKKKDKLHLLLGLKEILLDIDKAIRIVRDTEKDEDVVPNLMKGFNIDEIQAEYVAEIKLRNLNKQYILKRLEDIETLIDEIKHLEEILASEKEIKKVIIKDLQAIIKKYATERKTQIISDEEIAEYKEEQFIENYNLKVFFTKENYFKKISLVSLRSASEQKLKENDEIVCEFESSNIADVLFFSDKENVYKARLHEISDCKASAWGEYLPNILGLPDDEKIVYAVPTEKYTGNILFAFENGKVAKVPMASYETKTNRKKLANAYGHASPLAAVLYMPEEEDIALFASSGKILVTSSENVPLKATRSTQGVQIMRLKKGSTLKNMLLLKEAGLAEPENYRTRNIPSGGHYPSGSDDPQISLF